jgi:hypothetical protein
MGEMMILLWRPKHVSNPIDFDYERVEKKKKITTTIYMRNYEN